ncbi:MAG: uracil-DNA glycosylase family protein [Coriobacteriia bacterium]|nr:uracil-DNA glycosylase family protein [Coriobacteriia bacterium]
MQPTQRDITWLTATLKARALDLEPFAAYLSCGPKRALESMVLVVKGQRGAAEEAGGVPFSGRDGAALKGALVRLGWINPGDEDANWCGVLLAPLSVAPLSAAPLSTAPLSAAPLSTAPLSAAPLTKERLRLLIEIIDPVVIVTLDEEARQATGKAMLSQQTLSLWHPKTAIDAGGRLLVSVHGFEAALGSEAEKQLVWQQLKQASRAELLKRFR